LLQYSLHRTVVRLAACFTGALHCIRVHIPVSALPRKLFVAQDIVAQYQGWG